MVGVDILELYFKYRRVRSQFRSDALGNEIERIAADFSKTAARWSVQGAI
jgi:hypothetical protein